MADRDRWSYGISAADGRTYIQDEEFQHDVRLYINGDFRNDIDRQAYAMWVCDKLNAADSLDAERKIALLRSVLEALYAARKGGE